MNRILFSTTVMFLLSVTCLTSCKQQPEQQKSKTPIPTEIPWSQRMAETIMHDYPQLWRTEDSERIGWSYTKGLAGDAYIALWRKTGENDYFEYAKAYADTMIDEVRSHLWV